MGFSQLMKEKKKYSKLIKEEYDFPRKNKLNWLVVLNDKDLLVDFVDALWSLDANFVVVTDFKLKTFKNVCLKEQIKREMSVGFDFILCDDDISSLWDYMNEGIIPITSKNNHMSSILKEFDPIRNTGNCFLYEGNNKWSIFYALIRYLENSKFSFDNKNLVKNVLEV